MELEQKISKEELFILKRMIEGDENAFKYFFETYYDDLCNFVNSYVRDETLSEDIVQNIYIYLWEKKNYLSPDCSIKSYLYAASKNKSLNHLRNEKNKNRILSDLFSQTKLESQNKSDLFLEYEDLKKIVLSAINYLPTRCKVIYQLSRNEGLSNKEIAERLGISIKTVENQMSIAMRKIRDYLQPYFDHIFMLFVFANFIY
jgi:RNA polymerase sigma-70 factor, ECF subfamily